MTMGRRGQPNRGQPPISGRPPIGGRPPMPGGPVPPRGDSRAGGSFTDRVMSRVAAEPTPSPGRVLLRSLRHLALRDAFAALMAAWRLAFEPTGSVSPATRASAAGVFLSVVLIVGVGSAMVSAGALAFLGSDGQQLPVPAASPSTSPSVVPEASPSPSVAPSPSPSVEPSPSPSPSARPTPTPTAKPSAEDERERSTPKPTRKPQRSSDDDKDDEREEREKDEKDESDEREREKDDD